MVVFDRLTDPGKPAAVALGLFDGVHRGHHAVIERVVNEAANGFLPTVLTFSTDHVLPERKKGMKRILTESLFLDALEEIGVEAVEILPFEAIMELSPRAFFEEILLKRLGAKVLSCGEDFRFGKGAAGDLTLLKELCEEHGLRLEAVSPVLEDGAVISATRIRRCLLEGAIEEANRLLGFSYRFDFEVVHGNELGRTVGIPTINQAFPDPFVVPKFGVYASYAYLDGKRYKAITNVGVKPTVGSERRPLAETHIIGVQDDLYGKKVKVSLERFIRPEQKFAGFEELFAEIRKNIEEAKQLLDE